MRMIENIDIIKREMKIQNKGLRIMSEKLGCSTATVKKCRDGQNVTVQTLQDIAHELGYKIAIVRDETVTKTIYRRKKPIKKR